MASSHYKRGARRRRRRQKPAPPEPLTDDDGVVVGDEHLAVDVDELGDRPPLQLGVGPQTGDGDVVDPLVSHWEQETGSPLALTGR